MRADVRDEDSVTRAVEGSGAVVNAVGLYVERGEATFDAVHVLGARHVARQSARAGIARLVHVSGIGAEPNSESSYVRARAAGEAAVREAFPGATILRPSVLFGPEDAFFNTLAALARVAPALPLFGGGMARLQPVYVDDLATLAVDAARSGGNPVIDAVGPEVYTFQELVRLIAQAVESRAKLVHLPPRAALLGAKLLGLVVKDVLLTKDEVDGLLSNLLVTASAGTAPTKLSDWLYENASRVGTRYASELSRHYK